MFAFLSATLGFFSKLGLALGIALSVWTVYYATNHSKPITEYNMKHSTADKGRVIVQAGIMDGRTDFVQHRQREAFEYAAWYSAKSGFQKAVWLCVWCPIIGFTFSMFGLAILLRAAVKLVISTITLGRC